VAAVAGVIAAAALGWSLLLVTLGGFDATIAGVTITSNDARRPALVGLIAFAVFVRAYGWSQFQSRVLLATQFVTTRVRRLAPRLAPLEHAIVPVLAAGVFVTGVLGATGVAGGSDSFGYMSQAELWQRGLPNVPQPWSAEPPWPRAPHSFSPLGYRAVGDTLKPIYAVGLPLLMAAMKRIGGQPAIFLIEPAAAALLVFVAYGIGRRLATPRTGLVAAVLMATNWTLLAEMTAPMSDVVAAAGLAGAVYFLLGRRPRVIAAGLAAAVAILVRPNLVPSLPVLAIWLALDDRAAEASGWRPRLLRVSGFLAAASPGFFIPAWAYWRLFGSPFVSGYGGINAIYEWSSVPPNLLQYPRYAIETHAPLALAGLVAWCVPARMLWPSVSRTMQVFILGYIVTVVVPYYFFEPASNPAYLRYLLPVAPIVMVGGARLLVLVARPGVRAAVVTLFVIAYGANSVRALVESGGFDQRPEYRYPAVAALVRRHTAPTSVIYAAQHSGSIRYYGGRVTLNFVELNAAWLDRSIDWLAEHGAHPYALLDYWEVPQFKQQFPGARRLAQLDAPPIVAYRGIYPVYLYDLLRAPDDVTPPVTVVDRYDGPRFPLPIEMPQFGFRR